MSDKRTTQQNSRKPMRSTTGRVFGSIGLFIVAFVLYWVCDGLFDGYARYHALLLTWIAVSVISAVGLTWWLVDEHRHSDDED